MKRDVIDYLGNKIGEMDFEDDASESFILSSLSKFAKPPPTAGFADVTPRQIRQALVMSGISLDSIDTSMNALPEPMKTMAKIEWEYSVGFQRSNQLVNMMGQSLGFNQAMLDALWMKAKSL
jgi:hypothetical protein